MQMLNITVINKIQYADAYSLRRWHQTVCKKRKHIVVIYNKQSQFGTMGDFTFR